MGFLNKKRDESSKTSNLFSDAWNLGSFRPICALYGSPRFEQEGEGDFWPAIQMLIFGLSSLHFSGRSRQDPCRPILLWLWSNFGRRDPHTGTGWGWWSSRSRSHYDNSEMPDIEGKMTQKNWMWNNWRPRSMGSICFVDGLKRIESIS